MAVDNIEQIKPKLLPGYFATPPILESVRQLPKYGGLNDAYVQCLQIAFSRFRKEAESSSEGIRSFVNAAAADEGLHLGMDDFDPYESAVVGAQLVQAYQVLETLMRNMREEVCRLRGIKKWITNKAGKDLDVLAQYAANAPKASRTFIRSTPEYQLLNYYRLVRNWHIHAASQRLISVEKTHEKLVLNTGDHFSFNYDGVGSAPNPPTKLVFDDFFLFARAVKYFSNILNNHSGVTFDHLADALVLSKKLRYRLESFKNKPDKRRSTVRRWYRAHYGSISNSEFNHFMNLVAERLNIV